jgi:hypothetical protein
MKDIVTMMCDPVMLSLWKASITLSLIWWARRWSERCACVHLRGGIAPRSSDCSGTVHEGSVINNVIKETEEQEKSKNNNNKEKKKKKKIKDNKNNNNNKTK